MPEEDRVPFFVDSHYYAVKYNGEYSQDIIRHPPALDMYVPFLRIEMDEVGYGSDSMAGVEAVENADVSYFTTVQKEDPAMPGILFLSQRLELGDAIISPDRALFILIDESHYRQEAEIRRICIRDRIAVDGRQFPIGLVREGIAVVQILIPDHDLVEWVSRNYGSRK
jgi:hypothetical protein